MKSKSKNKVNVLFISSTGGHLNELLQLSPMFKNYNYYIISLKDKYPNRVFYLVYGSRKHMLSYPFKFGFNCFKSLYYYFKLHPKFIVTTGTHTAVPMCYIARLFGSKVIFIETFANRNTKTLAGKLVYPIANLFIVQWEEMLKLYPKAVYGGWIY